MRQSGRQLSSRCKPIGLAEPGLRLFPFRQVLKDAHEANESALGRLHGREVDPDRNRLAILTRNLKLLGEFAKGGRGGGEERLKLLDLSKRGLSPALISYLFGRDADDPLRTPVQRHDLPVEVQRHDPARDMLNDVLVKGSEIAEVNPSYFQLETRLFEPSGKLTAQYSHKKKSHAVDEELQERVCGIVRDVSRDEELRPLREPIKLDAQQCAIENSASAGEQQARSSGQEDGRGQDWKDVDKRKGTLDPAGIVYQGSNQDDVDPDLQATEPHQPRGAVQHEKIEDGEKAGTGDEDEEGGQCEGGMLPEGEDACGAQKQECDEEPEADQPLELSSQRGIFRRKRFCVEHQLSAAFSLQPSAFSLLVLAES